MGVIEFEGRCGQHARLCALSAGLCRSALRFTAFLQDVPSVVLINVGCGIIFSPRIQVPR